MIRGIIFDCFGVLYEGSLGLLVSMAPKGRARDIIDLNSQKDYGYMSYREYLVQTAEVIGTTVPEIERIINQKHTRNHELVEYVRMLKRQSNYRIGLLSNVGESVIQDFFGHEIDELFDAVVLSYREGIAKPNPEIFRLMAERIDLAPGECLMIDDLEENCEGAEIAGMQSIRHVANASTIRQIEYISSKSD